jgi:hypothetical protein
MCTFKISRDFFGGGVVTRQRHIWAIVLEISSMKWAVLEQVKCGSTVHRYNLANISGSLETIFTFLL